MNGLASTSTADLHVDLYLTIYASWAIAIVLAVQIIALISCFAETAIDNWPKDTRYRFQFIFSIDKRLRSRNGARSYIYIVETIQNKRIERMVLNNIREREIKAVAKRQWRIDGDKLKLKKLLSAVERKLFFVLKLSQIKFSSVSCAQQKISGASERDRLCVFVLSIGWCSCSNPLYAVAVSSSMHPFRFRCRVEYVESSVPNSRVHDSNGIYMCLYEGGALLLWSSFSVRFLFGISCCKPEVRARAQLFSISSNGLELHCIQFRLSVETREYGVNRAKGNEWKRETVEEKKRNTNFLAKFNWQCLDTRTTTNMCNVHSHLAWCNTCQDETGNIIRKR